MPSWQTVGGKTLTDLVGYNARHTGFDWTTLHIILNKLPAGSWASYGDLAEVAGTSAQSLGVHVTSCEKCANAHRILGSNGRSRDGFQWSDPSDTRTQQEVLETEGVVFTNRVAEAGHRLGTEELTSKLPAE